MWGPYEPPRAAATAAMGAGRRPSAAAAGRRPPSQQRGGAHHEQWHHDEGEWHAADGGDQRGGGNWSSVGRSGGPRGGGWRSEGSSGREWYGEDHRDYQPPNEGESGWNGDGEESYGEWHGEDRAGESYGRDYQGDINDGQRRRPPPPPAVDDLGDFPPHLRDGLPRFVLPGRGPPPPVPRALASASPPRRHGGYEPDRSDIMPARPARRVESFHAGHRPIGRVIQRGARVIHLSNAVLRPVDAEEHLRRVSVDDGGPPIRGAASSVPTRGAGGGTATKPPMRGSGSIAYLRSRGLDASPERQRELPAPTRGPPARQPPLRQPPPPTYPRPTAKRPRSSAKRVAPAPPSAAAESVSREPVTASTSSSSAEAETNVTVNRGSTKGDTSPSPGTSSSSGNTPDGNATSHSSRKSSAHAASSEPNGSQPTNQNTARSVPGTGSPGKSAASASGVDLPERARSPTVQAPPAIAGSDSTDIPESPSKVKVGSYSPIATSSVPRESTNASAHQSSSSHIHSSSSGRARSEASRSRSLAPSIASNAPTPVYNSKPRHERDHGGRSSSAAHRRRSRSRSRSLASVRSSSPLVPADHMRIDGRHSPTKSTRALPRTSYDNTGSGAASSSTHKASHSSLSTSRSQGALRGSGPSPDGGAFGDRGTAASGGHKRKSYAVRMEGEFTTLAPEEDTVSKKARLDTTDMSFLAQFLRDPREQQKQPPSPPPASSSSSHRSYEDHRTPAGSSDVQRRTHPSASPSPSVPALQHVATAHHSNRGHPSTAMRNVPQKRRLSATATDATAATTTAAKKAKSLRESPLANPERSSSIERSERSHRAAAATVAAASSVSSDAALTPKPRKLGANPGEIDGSLGRAHQSSRLVNPSSRKVERVNAKKSIPGANKSKPPFITTTTSSSSSSSSRKTSLVSKKAEAIDITKTALVRSNLAPAKAKAASVKATPAKAKAASANLKRQRALLYSAKLRKLEGKEAKRARLVAAMSAGESRQPKARRVAAAAKVDGGKSTENPPPHRHRSSLTRVADKGGAPAPHKRRLRRFASRSPSASAEDVAPKPPLKKAKRLSRKTELEEGEVDEEGEDPVGEKGEDPPASQDAPSKSRKVSKAAGASNPHVTKSSVDSDLKCKTAASKSDAEADTKTPTSSATTAPAAASSISSRTRTAAGTAAGEGKLVSPEPAKSGDPSNSSPAKKHEKSPAMRDDAPSAGEAPAEEDGARDSSSDVAAEIKSGDHHMATSKSKSSHERNPAVKSVEQILKLKARAGAVKSVKQGAAMAEFRDALAAYYDANRDEMSPTTVSRRFGVKVKTLLSWVCAWREQRPASVPGAESASCSEPVGCLSRAEVLALKVRTGKGFSPEFKREVVRYMDHHKVKPSTIGHLFGIGDVSALRWKTKQEWEARELKNQESAEPPAALSVSDIMTLKSKSGWPYTPEFKREVVRYMGANDLTSDAVARLFDLDNVSVSRWKESHDASVPVEDKTATPKKPNPAEKSLQCLSKSEVIALRATIKSSNSYVPEFRREVVRYMDAHELTSAEVGKLFCIGDTLGKKWKARQEEDEQTNLKLAEPIPGQCLSKSEVIALRAKVRNSKSYVPEFKREVVRFMDAHELTSAEVGKLFSIGDTLGKKWKASQEEEERTNLKLDEPIPGQCLSKSEVMALKVRNSYSYNPEFQREVVRYMDAHKLNSFRVSKLFGIGDAAASKWKAKQEAIVREEADDDGPSPGTPDESPCLSKSEIFALKATQVGLALPARFKRELVRYMEHHELTSRQVAAEFEVSTSTVSRARTEFQGDFAAARDEVSEEPVLEKASPSGSSSAHSSSSPLLTKEEILALNKSDGVAGAPVKYNEEFQREVARYQQRHGLTFTAAGKLFGISKQTVSNWRNKFDCDEEEVATSSPDLTKEEILAFNKSGGGRNGSKYPEAFRRGVTHYQQRHGLTFDAAGKLFGISRKTAIAWFNKFGLDNEQAAEEPEEQPTGASPSAESSHSPSPPSKSSSPLTKEDILALHDGRDGQRYTEEYKREVTRYIRRHDLTSQEAGETFGMSSRSAHNWLNKFEEEDEDEEQTTAEPPAASSSSMDTGSPAKKRRKRTHTLFELKRLKEAEVKKNYSPLFKDAVVDYATRHGLSGPDMERAIGVGRKSVRLWMKQGPSEDPPPPPEPEKPQPQLPAVPNDSDDFTKRPPGRQAKSDARKRLESQADDRVDRDIDARLKAAGQFFLAKAKAKAKSAKDSSASASASASATPKSKSAKDSSASAASSSASAAKRPLPRARRSTLTAAASKTAQSSSSSLSAKKAVKSPQPSKTGGTTTSRSRSRRNAKSTSVTGLAESSENGRSSNANNTTPSRSRSRSRSRSASNRSRSRSRSASTDPPGTVPRSPPRKQKAKSDAILHGDEPVSPACIPGESSMSSTVTDESPSSPVNSMSLAPSSAESLQTEGESALAGGSSCDPADMNDTESTAATSCASTQNKQDDTDNTGLTSHCSANSEVSQSQGFTPAGGNRLESTTRAAEDASAVMSDTSPVPVPERAAGAAPVADSSPVSRVGEAETASSKPAARVSSSMSPVEEAGIGASKPATDSLLMSPVEESEPIAHSSPKSSAEEPQAAADAAALADGGHAQQSHSEGGGSSTTPMEGGGSSATPTEGGGSSATRMEGGGSSATPMESGGSSTTPMAEAETENEEEELYSVEGVAARRIIRNRVSKALTLQYYVKWVGYSSDENTWEPAANLQGQGVVELVQAFDAARPVSPELRQMLVGEDGEDIGDLDEDNAAMYEVVSEEVA